MGWAGSKALQSGTVQQIARSYFAAIRPELDIRFGHDLDPLGAVALWATGRFTLGPRRMRAFVYKRRRAIRLSSTRASALIAPVMRESAERGRSQVVRQAGPRGERSPKDAPEARTRHNRGTQP